MDVELRRLVMVVVAAFALAAPAAASAKPLVGIGDQKPTMFGDPRFAWLKLSKTRIVVSWRIEQTPWERRYVDSWMKAAHAAGVQPLVGFGHAWTGPQRRVLPSVAQYAKAVGRFRAKYPWVRDFIAWNEANHCSQPTCHRPDRAAAYYDTLRSECPRCKIVGADVIDQGNMVSWLKAFRTAARHRVTLWGLHNYLDVNRLRDSGTLRFLRAVPGHVWITETGGLVRRNHYRNQIAFEESPAHAAKAVSFALQLAARQKRIQRVYLYQWNSDSPENAWDSGFIGWMNDPRPAFDVLARFRGMNPAKAPNPNAVPPGTTPPSPPPDQQPPPPPDQQPPPPQQPPYCVLEPLCR